MTAKTTNFINMDTDPQLDDPVGEVQAQFEAYEMHTIDAKPKPDSQRDKIELERLRHQVKYLEEEIEIFKMHIKALQSRASSLVLLILLAGVIVTLSILFITN